MTTPAKRLQVFGQFDTQDYLLLLGVLFVIGGIAAWSRPAASVVFGLMCLGLVFHNARPAAPAADQKVRR